MAFIGLSHPVWAPFAGDEIEGQEIQYGTGVVIGEAIMADVTFNRSDTRLYASNKLTESDNSITGGTVRINTDDIDDAVLAQIINMETGEEGEYIETGDASPYGGFGYVRTRKKKSKTTHVAMWVYKVQLGIATETANTKGQQTEYQTPTMEGNMMGVIVDAGMKVKYRERKSFETEAEAIAWLDAKANITAEAANA
jgi:hypothetical protein